MAMPTLVRFICAAAIIMIGGEKQSMSAFSGKTDLSLLRFDVSNWPEADTLPDLINVRLRS